MPPDSDDAVLWPARHVGEHAYCPRLFYYMQVEGVFVPSSDTEQGRGVHARVDRPSADPAEPGLSTGKPIPAGPASGRDQESAATQPDASAATPDLDRPRAVRSLALASNRLELTATLDLAEVSGEPFAGGVAVPVEYRKGRPKLLDLSTGTDAELEPGQQPLARAEPWPTDRVQVGLQAILLEEAGYTVPHAVLYYAQTRARLTIPVDDQLRAEAIAELEAAKRTAAGPRPLPLVDDPKCPRCSLQPICLPDEINHQRRATLTIEGRPAGEPISPRRIWPPRDDGIHVAAQTEGVKIGVRGASLRLSDRDGGTVREMPIASVESLAIVGSVQLSTQALHVLADHAVPVVYMTAAGRCVAWVDPPTPTSAATRLSQAHRCVDPASRLTLAGSLISAKIANQRTLLMRNAPDAPPSALDELSRQARSAESSASIDELLGHEGQAAAVYFAHFARMLRDESARAAFNAHGRKRRPPPDPINACLSFAYAMLTHECVSALRTASLEPTIGALHATRPGKPALALDLMEPFRPLIADSVALSLFNRGEVGQGHFLRTAAGCALTDHGRRAFFNAWGRRMATEVTHPVFDYRLSYRRMLMLHARLIAAWFNGEAPTLAFLTTR
jgi:CRISPR-associated protein Cas1